MYLPHKCKFDTFYICSFSFLDTHTIIYLHIYIYIKRIKKKLTKKITDMGYLEQMFCQSILYSHHILALLERFLMAFEAIA